MVPTLLVGFLIIAPTWVCLEAAFFVWWQRAYAHLNQQPNPHRPADPEHARRVFDRFIRDQATISKYICINEMLSKWYWGVPADRLTKRDVTDLLCYGFWYRSQEQMEADGLGPVADGLVDELQAAWGVSFPDADPGAQPGAARPPMMSHLWQPVRAFWRPLGFYAGVELLVGLKHVMLLAAGFRPYRVGGLRYYTYGLPPLPPAEAAPEAAAARVAAARREREQEGRPAAPAAPAAAAPAAAPPRRGGRREAAGAGAAEAAEAPLLFLHGVGLGLLPYLNFLLQLCCLGRPAVAVEVRHLSMRACWEVPEEDEIVDWVAAALDAHGLASVHVVAHSYGTFMASRLVQRRRRAVASLTLLDPVCFIMYNGKLIYNFVYRSPMAGASFLTWFIARDLAHSVSVSRRFYWSLLNLWPDQLPQHTLVAMGARDELVPVPEVLTMLEAHPDTRVLLHRHHRHADFIKDLRWQARMVQEVAELVAGAAGAGHVTHARSDSASSYEVMAGLNGGSSGGSGGGAGAGAAKKTN
ncbi:hypothetical protein HXX76_004880 [Chlamydomonas incerta]|uniref:AB hydrolase-1 domain-containing protein n=1 Tax=Chlamydomonas incerta TaxID=51695 RepID=A0A835W3S7_CHLIN|nr:hypothetical protein HXX76_004880 [Chlamydomonas incerta]|eukprot:KAG2439527.1 hypothetical protein HXX76_004880 [Chlamydomonas incerta]